MEEPAAVPAKTAKTSALLDTPSCIAATTTTLGINGRIFRVGSEPKAFGSDELGLQQRWYPIKVNQKAKAGRPDIDQFETAIRRAKCAKGFSVSFAFSADALRESQRFFVEEHAIIVPLTVQKILKEQIGMTLV